MFFCLFIYDDSNAQFFVKSIKRYINYLLQ